jgi:hypothetical protein
VIAKFDAPRYRLATHSSGVAAAVSAAGFTAATRCGHTNSEIGPFPGCSPPPQIPGRRQTEPNTRQGPAQDRDATTQVALPADRGARHPARSTPLLPARASGLHRLGPRCAAHPGAHPSAHPAGTGETSAGCARETLQRDIAERHRRQPLQTDTAE